MQRQGEGRNSRATGGYVFWFSEELEGSVGGHNGGKQYNGPQEGDGYFKKLLHPRSAVYTGGLVNGGVNILQTRQIEDSIIPGPAPGDNQDNNYLCPEWVGKPAYGLGKEAQF